MGRSGSSRKGRKLLPKVGTRPAMDQELADRRTRALHPFAEDPWRPSGARSTIIPIVVVLLILIGIIAVVVAT